MNFKAPFLNFFNKRMLLLGLLCLSVTLSACSTRWAYNQLDWIVPWYLDDYVVLNDYQEPEFEASLDEWLYWHRSTQLEQYATLLTDIKQYIQIGLSENAINRYSTQVDFLLQNAFTKMGDDFVPLLEGLSREQKRQILVNLGKKSEEYAEKNVLIGEKESREKAQAKMIGFMQDLLGDLSEPQLQLIDNWAQQKPWVAPHFIRID